MVVRSECGVDRQTDGVQNRAVDNGLWWGGEKLSKERRKTNVVTRGHQN